MSTVGILLALVTAGLVFWLVQTVMNMPTRRRLQRRIAPHLGLQPVAAAAPVRRNAGARGRLDDFLDSAEARLARFRFWDAFTARAERADAPRAIELLFGSVVLGLVVGVFGLATSSPVWLLLGPGAVFLVVWLGLGIKAQRRMVRFEQQLPDVLTTLAGSLRAGHGFLQSLQTIAYDTPAPAGKEFRRVLTESQLGRPIEDALADLTTRVQSEDLVFVVNAIVVQRQVGGSLAGLFDIVNETVRQRQQFARKVRALTAMGKQSAGVVIAAPIGIALLMTAMNHAYMAPLFHSSAGRVMLLGAAASMLLGAFVLRRIVAIRG